MKNGHNISTEEWTDEKIEDFLSIQGIDVFQMLKEELDEEEYLDFCYAYEDWRERHKLNVS
jgi:hypothetical protein